MESNQRKTIHESEQAKLREAYYASRAERRDEWWKDWGRKQQEARIVQTAGQLTIQGEIDVP